MVVSIALRNGIVHDVSESSRHEAAESVVVRVFVGEQPFDDEVWLLEGWSWQVFPIARLVVS